MTSRRTDGSALPPLRVLVVGHTPPPYGGSALALASFLAGSYEGLRLHHVRTAFSGQMGEMGKFRWRKLGHLAALLPRILWARFRTRSTVLYYCPPGPDLAPVLRDLVILLATRWAFRQTVFHFHAGGLSQIYRRLSPWLRVLFRWAYCRPALAIQTSARNPPDGEFLRARRTVVVPNGVADHFPGRRPPRQHPPVILFVGVIRESKGVLVLLDACRHLCDRGVEFELRLVGDFESPEFERRVRATVDDYALAPRTRFLGVLVGEPKHEAILNSSMLCFPTHFEAESFGLVLLEAMQMELPVVATRWRGVPDCVADGITGVLVPPRDAPAMADGLQHLIENPEVAERMGRCAREVYLQRFTEDRYRADLQEALLSINDGSNR